MQQFKGTNTSSIVIYHIKKNDASSGVEIKCLKTKQQGNHLMTLLCVYDFCVVFLTRMDGVLCREKKLCETPNAQVKTQG